MIIEIFGYAILTILIVIFSGVAIFMRRIGREDRRRQQRFEEHCDETRVTWVRINEVVWNAAGVELTKSQKLVLRRLIDMVFNFICSLDKHHSSQYPPLNPFFILAREAMETYGISKKVVLAACHLILDKFSRTKEYRPEALEFAAFTRKLELSA